MVDEVPVKVRVDHDPGLRLHERRHEGRQVPVGDPLDRELKVENHYRFAPERYVDMTVPTLVLAGAESAPSVRADAEAVAAGLPDARLTLLAGQRHGCLHRAPELFADTVLDFLGH